MPRPRSSSGKRDREFKKRERERMKREKAALKRRRRDDRHSGLIPETSDAEPFTEDGNRPVEDRRGSSSSPEGTERGADTEGEDRESQRMKPEST